MSGSMNMEFQSDMMTLDEAIKKARDLGLTLSCKPETKEEGREQIQLAKWLEELRDLRNSVSRKRSAWFEGF